ncbi:MAG: 1-deoxy-D-xylulose-5-phosphate synthase [Spirochaetia bacterium]|nr:1-deoxy-D-xylulose-5-phosphate synthase [Spirochaetia bacterium]
MNLLDSINSPEDLKQLGIHQLPELCVQIRDFMLHTLSEVGGHLSSNLGTIELSVALHYVFNSPNDKLIWDVGHQTYTHKILTGRKKKLYTVRKTGGLSGFPKSEESVHDLYNAGHAGNSISLALGEAVARDLQRKQGSVISIIGDASIASGMAFEAMNHAGHLKNPFLVVLNDNEMSISKSVGGLSYVLTSMINTRLYRGWSRRCYKIVRWLPFGIIFERLWMRFGSSMKSIITDHQFFEELGFRYLGPLEGHDVIKLVHMLEKLKNLEMPTILHVVTRKGKGYKHAEENPTLYHGVSPFEQSTGQMKLDTKEKPLSELVGETLTVLSKKDPKICVITPAMAEGSGLISFSNTFPDRFFDTGISEQHATAFSGALAKSGLKPFLCIYSTFLQRSYDQLIHDIALMNLPVKLLIDRAGIVGGDGETHQGLFDISYMYPVPNLHILSPSNPEELHEMLIYASQYKESAIAIRFPKRQISNDFLNSIKSIKLKPVDKITSKVLQKGDDVVIFSEGFMAQTALDAAAVLKSEGISVEVVSLKTIKPLDTNTLSKSLKGKRFAFSIEDHYVSGGAGSIIESELTDELANVHFHRFGYPDKFIEHGSITDIQKIYKLDAKSIANSIKEIIQKKEKPEKRR